MNSTKITWTDSTWNPLIGCSKASEGCEHCYAIKMAARLAGNKNPEIRREYDDVVRHDGTVDWTGRVKLLHRRLGDPQKKKSPMFVFVCSMSDLFHPNTPNDAICEIFGVMKRCSWHTFQVLTKRPGRMAEVAKVLDWPRNVWAGVTVEAENYVDRIDALRAVPAAVRYLSIEPMLSPLPSLNLDRIDWVIAGCESGKPYRETKHEWVRDVRQQCKAANVAFLLKQLRNQDGRLETCPILDGRRSLELPRERRCV